MCKGNMRRWYLKWIYKVLKDENDDIWMKCYDEWIWIDKYHINNNKCIIYKG